MCHGSGITDGTWCCLQFLHNVSVNLKEGGYFIGTVPDGKRINECIKRWAHSHSLNLQ
jgi:hypothetical protein